MEKTPIHSVMKKAVLPVIVVLVMAAFFAAFSGRFPSDIPEIGHEDGFADIRGYDFGTQVYNLVNNWDFYPGALYTPRDFADAAAAPQPDNQAKDMQLGTYRLRLLAKPHQWLSLCSFSVDYGTRVFLNGEEVRNIGFVSADPGKAVPKGRYMTIPMYSGESGEIELIYQYSNFVHNEGGFIQATYISAPENIDEFQRGIAFWSILIAGGLIFLMFWFLLCASIQKSSEYAALALCCLVIALRNQFFFAEYLLYPGYDFFTEYRLLVLDASLIPAAALFLLCAFFPKAVGKKIPISLAGVFAVLTALHWILDTKELVGLCHVCYYVCAPFLLWCIICLCRYYIKVRRPDYTELISLAAVCIFIVMLIREGLSAGSVQSVAHFGLTPAAMVACVMLLAVVINGRIKRQIVALEQVRQQNRLLEHTNDMNRDFLRMVAHELKTPLTVISGYAQLIGRQAESSGQSCKTTERLRTIRSEADRLGTIVTGLMDYTYNKPRQAEMGEVDVTELLNSVSAVMSPVCEKKHNTLTVSAVCGHNVRGNADLLLQVLINLIANACRFTENGVISAVVSENGSNAVFTVADTGSGIPPEAVPHIFEKGFTTGEGSGIGLSVCKETVELHDGALELVSTGTEGTVFRFTVPIYKP